ncbi:MAG: methyltransferase domain-containing protein [Candidatus Falkowbacteria bacterium]|nr:MAG: methyltransferase domain-containing protein [Candidatus Falkowbacteria bacterium]
MLEIKKTALFDITAILNKISIGERQKVAELGCGNFGFFTFPLARLVGRSGKVYAVDILKSTLTEIKDRAAKENLPQIIPVWSNLEIFKATKIETESLDGALLVNVLHQSDKRAEIIREAYRMLKRSGRLMIVEWNSADSPLGPKPEKRLKLESLKLAAKKLGFDIQEEFSAGPYHYGLLLIKL